MKKTLLTLISFAALLPAAWSQDRIYRCGNEYTNNPNLAKERGCKLVEGGNVTVVPGAKPGAAPVAAPAPAATAARTDNSEQRARDADAKAILEAELRKTQARLAEVKKEYNDGAPERNALELRNPQVYMERIAALKASIARLESDVAGIQRELGRLSGAGK